MTEVDNAAYHIGLSEPVRVRVELGAKVELRQAEIDMLGRSKYGHVALIVVAALMGVASKLVFPFIFVPLAFIFAGAVEGDANQRPAVKAIVISIVKGGIGFVLWMGTGLYIAR